MRTRQKGIRALNELDNPAHVTAGHASRLKRILIRLNPLKGDQAGQWIVCVSGNWRVTFRFENGEAVDVDLIDYH